ncbi:MAG: TonB family protein [Myxococcota bacterium]
MTRRPSQHAPADASSSPFDAVFGGPTPQRGRRGRLLRGLPWLVALSLHAVVIALSLRVEPSLETWSARMAAAVHQELADSAPVTIEEPPPAPAVEEPEEADPAAEEAPAEPPPEKGRPAPSPPAKAAAPREAEDEPEMAPSAAGEVIAAEADPDAPVDMTEHTIVTGSARAYAGGATAADGRSNVAVPPSAAGGDGESTGAARAGSAAHPVRLDPANWECAWPEDAVAMDIYEQTVVLRVVVRADGRAESVRVLDDPGHGFAEAAARCAKRTRFTPARDAGGRPVRATSPPIRVRFER